jgi:hypothetical protein
MKRLFTFVAIAMSFSGLYAQETYQPYATDGTMLAAYSDSTVIATTNNVTLTSISNPDDLSAAPWSIGNRTLNSTTGEKFYYLQGKGNPYITTYTDTVIDSETGKPKIDDNGNIVTRPGYTYYSPDGSVGLPIHGLYYKLNSKVAGTMKIAVWINKGSRKFFIVDEATKVALDTTMYKASGYINGQNDADGNMKFIDAIPHGTTTAADGTVTPSYIIGAGNQAIWGYVTFNVEAGKTYWVFLHSAQLGFGGFEFTPSSTEGINNMNNQTESYKVFDAKQPFYNIAGQRVDTSYKGVVMQNGKKYILK